VVASRGGIAVASGREEYSHGSNGKWQSKFEGSLGYSAPACQWEYYSDGT